jgi:cobalamin biosynthesis protein CobW
VKILRAEHGQMDVGVVLGLGAASEEHIHTRIGHHEHHDHDDDHDDDHEDHHDHNHDAFDAFVLPLPEMDKDALLAALTQLLQSQEIYRIKGFVALPGKAMRLVLHGVGKRLDSYFDRPWRADEARQSQLVFIGHDLDQAAIQLALQNAAAAKV